MGRDHSGWGDLEYFRFWESIRLRVNTKSAHQPELNERELHCALHDAKGIGPVFDTNFLEVMASDIAEELLEAKAKKAQGLSAN